MHFLNQERPAISFAFALLTTVPASALDPSRSVPAYFQYMIIEFFSPSFARGPRPVISQCCIPYIGCIALCFYFVYRKGWRK